MLRAVFVGNDDCFIKAAEKAVYCFFERRKEKVNVWHFESTTLLDKMKGHINFDIYLLDIEMPGMNGLELAEKVWALDTHANIAFFASSKEYAYQSLQIGVYDYILKNSYQKGLYHFLEHIYRKNNKKKEVYYFFFYNSLSIKIFLCDILYLTKEGKYVIFHCNENIQYKERNSLKNVFGRLPENHFVITGKGMIVNMEHIRQVGKMEVILEEGTVLPVSRRMEKHVKNKLEDYWNVARFDIVE